MARADDLKARLSAYLREQEAALAATTERCEAETARLRAQIAGAQQALVGLGGPEVEILLEALASAGIPIKP